MIRFILVSIVFFTIALVLTWFILLFASTPLVWVFGIILVVLEILYVFYALYEILSSKYCWILMSPIIILGFMSGFFPGLIMVFFIWLSRRIIFYLKEQRIGEVDKNGNSK